MSEIILRSAQFEGRDKEDISAIRTEVFVEEQQVPWELDFDGLDDAAEHVLLFCHGEPVATGRLLADGHIGRIAVRKSSRGQGFGRMIVNALVDLATTRRMPRVYLGAQLYTLDFYRKMGFVDYGEDFLDAGILHREMERFL